MRDGRAPCREVSPAAWLRRAGPGATALDLPPLTAVSTIEHLRHTRTEALALIGDLEREAAAIAASTAGSPDDEHDAEGSTIGFERARVASLLESARVSLAGVDEALDRARQGNYGRCDQCGDLIGEERLALLLTTTRCVACSSARVTARLPRRPLASPRR